MKQLRKKAIKPWLSLFTLMSALLLMGGTALATVDLDDSDTALTFAEEMTVSTSLDLDTNPAAELLDIKVVIDDTASPTVTAADTYYLRFDLSSNATFIGTPIPNQITGAGSSAANLNPTWVDGGHNESFVVFSISPALNNLAGTETFEIDMYSSGGIKVTDNESVTVSYSLWTDAAGEAAGVHNGTWTPSDPIVAGDFTGDSATYYVLNASFILWDYVLATDSAAFTAGNPSQIDVGQSSKGFLADGDDTNIGQATLTLTSDIYWSDGAVPRLSDLFSSAYLRVYGSFPSGAAMEDASSGTFTVNSTTASLGVNSSSASAYSSGDISYTLGSSVATGQQETTITAKFDLTVASGVTLNTGVETALETTFTLCSLEKNGSTKTVYNIPSPDNADTGYIRITNASDTACTSINGRLYLQSPTVAGTPEYNDVIIGTGGVAESIGAHETVAITNASLGTLTSISTWAGRAHLVLETSCTGMEVVNWLTNNGTTVNMSATSPDSNE
jgi:hypothetical protein